MPYRNLSANVPVPPPFLFFQKGSMSCTNTSACRDRSAQATGGNKPRTAGQRWPTLANGTTRHGSPCVSTSVNPRVRLGQLMHYRSGHIPAFTILQTACRLQTNRLVRALPGPPYAKASAVGPHTRLQAPRGLRSPTRALATAHRWPDRRSRAGMHTSRHLRRTSSDRTPPLHLHKVNRWCADSGRLAGQSFVICLLPATPATKRL